MEYRKYGETWYVRMDKGDEIIGGILELCRKEKIASAVFSGIGGCSEAEIQTFIPETSAFETQRLAGMLELVSMNGNVVSDSEGTRYHHTHAVFSHKADGQHRLAAGHMKSITVLYTAEIELRPVAGGTILRKRDEETGTGFWAFETTGKAAEKHTDLEQALHDATLAIITDRITTLRELNRAYIRYRALPKKQKRFSNYYSNEFLGHNVPEMYELIKNELNADDAVADRQLPGEKYAHSEPDLYYNESKFNAGDTNICFILGHSGSGKSVMARTLEGDEIDHIELDDLLLTKDHFTMEELKDYSDMFYSFFAGEGAKYYIGIEERNSIPKEDYEDQVFIDFVKFAMDYAKQHRDRKYIIDGIWLYLYFDDPAVFADYAVFVKGTSFLKSKIRATKREMQRDKETLKDRKQMFGREVRNYLLDEDKIDRYRSFFGGSADTVFRDEANEDAIVLSALNSIDRCFVNDDADGIRAIMKEAEADTGLSNWNKLRIINECNSALLELRLGNA